MGWDFESIWQWDTASNLPKLRPFTASDSIAHRASASQPSSSAKKISLLAKQMQENSWLA